MASDSPTVDSRLTTFTVGDWLVEPKACRVSRGDTVVKLRPQLTDLLVCLARRAGEIVLKDEILSEVWPGQYIAESGLSRCVAELRQSLQDHAQEPRFIETFPKRGYRLIAPVVWLNKVEREVAPPLHAEHGQHETQGTVGAAEVVLAPADAPKRQRAIGWRRGAWAAAAVALLLVGIVGIATLVRSPASALTEKDTVLLADVSNSTGDRVFDDTLRLALAVSLEQAPSLRILQPEVVRAAVVRTGTSPDARVVGQLALDVCRREGAAVLLAGSITPLGSRYAVGIQAIACQTGDVVASALAEADGKEHVLTALEQAATHIREKLGESRDSLRNHQMPLVRATTPSLEALKALTQGDFNRDHARVGDALALYRQATELDQDFALAWASRGAAALNLGLREEGNRALRRAFELKDRVTPQEGFYIAGHYYRFVAADPQKAIEIYQAWKRMYPGSAVPPTNLAGILSGMMGQYDAALPEGRDAVRLAPYSSLAYRNLVLACRGSNRIAEARQAVAEAAGRGIDDQILHVQSLNLALFDGDSAALEREVRWALTDPMAELFTLRARASFAMAGGRLREARQLWSQTLAKADEIGPATRVAEIRLFKAEAEALVGDPRAARTDLEAALVADKDPATFALAAIVSGLVGDSARARAILDGIAAQPASDSATVLAWLPTARAVVEIVLGRPDAALGLLKPVARFERGADFRLVPLGVRAIAERAARRPKDSAAAFDMLIGLRAVEPASPWVAFAQLGRARALRASGDAAGSLAAYDAFLESWKDADPDAPLLKVARGERAAIAQR
jgi:DNA-binding winged helix-turn-helix (wHTH) protein/tetratricopeptide (TPR) repeat protein